MFSHPTGWREARSQPREVLEARRADAEEAAKKIAAGAPLPPNERRYRILLGVAHLQWSLLELRALVRAPSEGDYRAQREDPLPPNHAGAAAWRACRSSRKLSVALAISEARLQVDGLRAFLFEAASPWMDLGPVEAFSGEPIEVEHPEGRILVLRHEGTWHALDGDCPHRGGSLADGWLEGGCVVCPIHEWSFELETGAARRGHGRVAVHEVEVRSGRLCVRRRGVQAS